MATKTTRKAKPATTRAKSALHKAGFYGANPIKPSHKAKKPKPKSTRVRASERDAIWPFRVDVYNSVTKRWRTISHQAIFRDAEIVARGVHEKTGNVTRVYKI